jgi:hypothetical protein
MSIWGIIISTIFIMGLVLTFIMRLKTSDDDFFPMGNGTFLPSFVPGWIIGLLVAILFVLGLREDRREINWWLITVGVFIMGGGLTGVIIQIISALPTRLYHWFSKKYIVKDKN